MIQTTLTRVPTNEAGRVEGLQQDSLHVALERVLDCEDAGPAFRGRLQRYAPFLAAELEDEEGPEGLLGELLEAEPGLANRVALLRSQHREILRSLDELLELLGREPASSPRCWGARRRLLRKLRDHRRAEARLVLDAHYRDVGGEGC
jgi:hypothetical protein